MYRLVWLGRYSDKVETGGSIPSTPTILQNRHMLNLRVPIIYLEKAKYVEIISNKTEMSKYNGMKVEILRVLGIDG